MDGPLFFRGEYDDREKLSAREKFLKKLSARMVGLKNCLHRLPLLCRIWDIFKKLSAQSVEE